jgi:TolB-like protein
MLITDLSKVKSFQVLERARFQALVEELGLGASGLVEPNSAPRVGRLLGAYWLIGGIISAWKGNQIRIQSDPLEVPTQKILGQPYSEGDLSDLFRMEKDLLFEITKLLKIEVTPEEEKELRKPCSTNIKALLALFKGIDASDRKNYKQAAEFYEKALKEDSNICTANGALNELKNLGLIGGNKKSSDLLHSLRDRSSLTDQLTPEDATKRERTPIGVPPSRTETQGVPQSVPPGRTGTGTLY